MRKGAACTFLAVLLLLFALPDARAQAKLGAHVGIDSWRLRPVAGVDARIDITELIGSEDASLGLVLNPTLEYRYIWGYGGGFFLLNDLIGDGHAYQLNGNVLFSRKAASEDASLYGGAGLMLSRISYTTGGASDTATTFGLNLLGGVNIQASDIFALFMQARLTLSPKTDFKLGEEDEGGDEFPDPLFRDSFTTRDATSLTLAIGVLFGS